MVRVRVRVTLDRKQWRRSSRSSRVQCSTAALSDGSASLGVGVGLGLGLGPGFGFGFGFGLG